MTKLSDQEQTRLALAALTACIVQTLDGGLEAFRARFERRLQQMYQQLDDAPGETLSTMETLSWVKEFLEREGPSMP